MIGSAQSCSRGVSRLGIPGGVSLAFLMSQSGLSPIELSQASNLAAALAAASGSKRRTESESLLRSSLMGIQREANESGSRALEAKAFGLKEQYSYRPQR